MTALVPFTIGGKVVQAECDAKPKHSPVYTSADDEGIGYGFPCPYCQLVDAYERHSGCAHARHRAWRRWRVTHWLVTKAYTLGISSSGCGVQYGSGCKGCLVSRLRFTGSRPYVLGVLTDHWRCLLKMRHIPADPIGLGFCSKCVPCPGCGSKTAGHEPGCDL